MTAIQTYAQEGTMTGTTYGTAYTGPYAPAVHPPTPAAARNYDRETVILTAVSIVLGLVILAPIALSMQGLVSWASDPAGLGLKASWPYLVPVALDGAAAACIGMTIVAAWRSERAIAFGALVWVFAGFSAFAQYSHGMVERDSGGAQDAWWALPAIALLGPLLLEMTLGTLRRWARKETGQQHHGAAGFGSRWLPGVAMRETLRAWAASRREGIDRAGDAIQFVRDSRTLPRYTRVEALHYAFGAIGVTDPHAARVWLAVRGVVVTQDDIDRAIAGRLVAPRPVSGGGYGAAEIGAPDHAERLRAMGTKRDRIRYALSALARMGEPTTGIAAQEWLAKYDQHVDLSECRAIARTEA